MSGAGLSGAGTMGAAVLGTGVYYLAFVIFRVSAQRMPPLRGSRPFHVAWSMLTDWVWFAGGVTLFVGLAYELVAFSELPLDLAQPVFAISLGLLLLFATLVLGERMSAREWLCVGLFGAATVLVGLSSGGESAGSVTATASPVRAIALAVPALCVAALVWLIGDRRSGGRHARPLAGVAYGIGAGVCAGLAEAGIRGIAVVYARHGDVTAVLRSPYPYLVLGMAGIALGQLQIALQRCRLAIVAAIITVIGRTQLVISGAVLFGDGWPDDPLRAALRVGGWTLAISATLFFPRHENPGTALPYGVARRTGPDTDETLAHQVPRSLR